MSFMPKVTKEVSIMDISLLVGMVAGLFIWFFDAGVDSTKVFNSLQAEITANTNRVLHLDKEIEDEKKEREKEIAQEKKEREKIERELKDAIQGVQARQEVIRTEQRQDNIEQNRKLDSIIRRLPNGS